MTLWSRVSKVSRTIGEGTETIDTTALRALGESIARVPGVSIALDTLGSPGETLLKELSKGAIVFSAVQWPTSLAEATQSAYDTD